jgi:hypothetical protein
MSPRIAWLLTVLVALALVAFAVCSRSERPAVTDWEPTWEITTAAVPSLATLGSPPDRAVCGHALGVLRSVQSDLFPTPDLAIDEAVREWVAIAEDAMFECPPSSRDLPDLATAYEELARLEAEVAAAIDVDVDAG